MININDYYTTDGFTYPARPVGKMKAAERYSRALALAFARGIITDEQLGKILDIIKGNKL